MALLSANSIWRYYVAVAVMIAAVLLPYIQHDKPSVLIGRSVVISPKFVIDGNTFYGTTKEGKMVRVRLRLVDAPELDQPYGKEARIYLKKLLLEEKEHYKGKKEHFSLSEVICTAAGIDEWGGLIADVSIHRPISDTSLDYVSVQVSMVNDGWAWAMDSGFVTNSRLHKMMMEARAARRGLWQSDNPVKPWEHRRKTQLQFHRINKKVVPFSIPRRKRVSSRSRLGKRRRKE
ncbi:Staphylococcal nuclease (SNase-like) [Trypanosoma melophagium]|uniref:Staphylococcal nuclease (SNase-like) n=1 Tax=Trypanosoma melophagium TaxID=715481 RepID=UPI00351A6F26|nr:Staphylococcal nuclease (SNase-like) [Trypanosoma melophagium]